MRFVRHLALVIVVSVIAPGGAAAEGTCSRQERGTQRMIKVSCSERLAGDWGGLLTESNGSTYRADISLATDGNGTISYGRLNCSGTLTYRSRQAAKYFYREAITEGVDNCTTGGDVVLEAVEPDGATLDFSWTGPSLAVKGRVSGVMTSGVTDGVNTSSSPGADGKDTCSRYLSNRENWVPMRCKVNDEDTE